ncbi:MAG: ABC-F family ATP-binding cassette domain-containing protein [Clostridia bacterium]|nr:ABC-F family ATP-binding cassette domain-containing protein [Clostridia bacterium]
MSVIQIENLSFTYPGSAYPVFEDCSFTMDTDWRLGLVGRNGRGKTTLMRLLDGTLTGSGSITASVSFDYFPFAFDLNLSARRAMKRAVAPFEEMEAEMARLLAQGEEGVSAWGELEHAYAAAGGYGIDAAIEKEAGELGFPASELERPVASFSPGERTRLMLGAMFLRRNRFLLIDEPTNHLDREGRERVAAYLKSKKGFLLVSHDRWFLDQTVDHICALHKTGMHVEQGNYSSYAANKARQDAFEQERNEKLQGDIRRLTETAREKAAWSDRVESGKIGGHIYDRGAVGHKAAKMMKRALAIERRTEAMIEEKKSLLRDIEYASWLTLHPLEHPARVLVRLTDAVAGYDGRAVLGPMNLEIAQGERVAVSGGNGQGKSTLLKLIQGILPPMGGRVHRASGLVISALPQLADGWSGTPREVGEREGLDLSYFLMLLRKLDFPREAFERDMTGFSMGQKKKVLLAASMARPAHLYLWDEPLNYIDLPSREQVENMLAETDATLLFVEHDRRFEERIATRRIELKRN